MINLVKYLYRRFLRNSSHHSFDDSFEMQKVIMKDITLQCIFDIGASEGQTAIKYSQLFPHADIYCFEPVKVSFKKLEDALRNSSNIKTINKAITAVNGPINIYINESQYTNSILPAEITHTAIDRLTLNKGIEKVESTTVDQFCIENKIDNIDILKMDIQGCELAALHGAARMLNTKKIKLIYSEIEFIRIYKDQPLLNDIILFLEKYNYHLFGMYNFNYLDSGQIAWADAIFI